MSHLFIFGMGYSASLIATRARALGWRVTGTGRTADLAFTDAPAVRAALASATHVLSSVPPADEQDPVLTRYGDVLGPAALAPHQWLGYLSSTGVYGDTRGAWVDETAPIASAQNPGLRPTRRGARVAADAQWLGLNAHVFRLPGIYGPAFGPFGGRSALDRVRQNKAHRLARIAGATPEQVFSRIHVEDIASAVLAALTTPTPPGAYNLADDLPCHPNLPIEEACRLLRLPLPPLQTLDEAALTPAARGFYAENRRITNAKTRRLLHWRPRYPTYAEGLLAIHHAES